MRTKRSIIGILLAVVLLSLCAVPALAAENAETTVNVIYYEDGSYMIVELTVGMPLSMRATNTISASRSAGYYSADDELLWDFTVHGTFKYDGTTATATDASYSYNIYNSAWELKSAEAYCSGNQAIAEGKFNGGFLLNRSTSITLTCSPDGVLS